MGSLDSGVGFSLKLRCLPCCPGWPVLRDWLLIQHGFEEVSDSIRLPTCLKYVRHWKYFEILVGITFKTWHASIIFNAMKTYTIIFEENDNYLKITQNFKKMYLLSWKLMYPVLKEDYIRPTFCTQYLVLKIVYLLLPGKNCLASSVSDFSREVGAIQVE